MKIVQINATCGIGSTGKICAAIGALLSQSGIDNRIFYTSGVQEHPKGVRYADDLYIKTQALRSRLLGNYGLNSHRATAKLISRLTEFAPDLVVLHNLHAHNCDLEMLFGYLKKEKKKIVWVFHDCWAFTGYCSHYDMIGCDRWKKEGCHGCPQKKYFSWFFDRSRMLFEKKKQLFLGLDLTIVTPSMWLAEQVGQSFLQEYPVKVINNGINLDVFKPTESDFRARYAIEDKYMILGVAFDWGERKGLDVFIELAKRLDERYQIVLVGTNGQVDKKLPPSIISIHRTNDQTELAMLYTAADVFVNPTREETFPTTHMEALACGTPVLAFDTGGCAEMLDETCGCVVTKNDVNALIKAIEHCCEARPYSDEGCTMRAAKYKDSDHFKKYMSLFDKTLQE